jgi:hypothetical protein
LPDRPAAAISNNKGTWLSVVGADNNAPVFVANRSAVTLGINAGNMLTVGDRYADGFVTIEDAYVSAVPTTNDAQTAVISASERFFWGTGGSLCY